MIAYDTLVLATGSNPVLPPLRGLFTPDHELPEGVHAFRTMDDCLGLSKAVRPGVRAVVIGGGLLGVSAARALAQRGAQVVLAQQSERLMERQLDPRASKLVRRHLRDLGVEVHTEPAGARRALRRRRGPLGRDGRRVRPRRRPRGPGLRGPPARRPRAGRGPRGAQGRRRRRRTAHLRPAHPRHRRLRPARRHRVRPRHAGPRTGRRAGRVAGRIRRAPATPAPVP